MPEYIKVVYYTSLAPKTGYFLTPLSFYYFENPQNTTFFLAVQMWLIVYANILSIDLIFWAFFRWAFLFGPLFSCCQGEGYMAYSKLWEHAPSSPTPLPLQQS